MPTLPYRDRVVDLTSELIGFRTTEDRPGEIDACMDRVAEFFDESGLTVTHHRFDGHPSLVATPNGSKTPTVMFHGHIDVVPGNDRLYAPSIEDEKLYGRGAADMKSGVAAMMHVLADLNDRADPPSVGMMVVSDEEQGGLNGARELLKAGYRPDFCITGEPNNLDGYMDIIIKQKGILELELSATGVSAHAATPEHGENAIEKLLDAYPQIKQIFEGRDKGWGTTANLGRISGGTVLNQVPDSATLGVDMRYPDLESRDEVLTELREIETVEIRSIGEGMPINTDPENPYVQCLLNSATAAIDEEVNFAHKPHASDLRHFAKYEIPGVAFGPEAYGSHEPFEHLIMSSIEAYCQTLYDFGVRSVDISSGQTVSSQ